MENGRLLNSSLVIPYGAAMRRCGRSSREVLEIVCDGGEGGVCVGRIHVLENIKDSVTDTFHMNIN